MVINVLVITVLVLSIIGCILIDKKLYRTHSILIIIILFNTFIISLMESIIMYVKGSNEILLYILTAFNSVVVIIKDLIIFKSGKSKKEYDLLIRTLIRLELITIIGLITLITYLAL